MNGFVHGSHGVSFEAPTTDDTAAAALTLAEMQKVAAERRAMAEELLAKARSFEEQITTENNAVAEATSTLAQVRERERQAAQELDLARKRVEEAQNAASEAAEERARAETALSGLRERLEALMASNGLSVDAVRRIIDRRIADQLRSEPPRMR